MVPENHVSIDIRSGYFLYAIILLFSLFVAWVRKSLVLPIMICVCSIVAMLGIYYADENNVVVQYDVWIKRGMPEKGEPKQRP